VHVGSVADSEAEVRDAYAAAIAAGAAQIHPPGPQLHYDPRYYAAQVKDPAGAIASSSSIRAGSTSRHQPGGWRTAG
jgi:hypothetical protein